jgi:hypothetical protein
MSSEVPPCIATNTPGYFDSAANIVAPSKFNAASEEGLSDDRCAPTSTTGTGNFWSAKLRAAAV